MTGNIAAVYAQPLFEAADEANELDEIWEELQSVTALIRKEPDFMRLLAAPTLSKAEKTEAVTKVFGGKLHPYLFHFMRLLAQNGRMAYLDQICDAFETRYQEKRGILSVTAVTAVPLSAALREKLTGKLASVTGKQICLTEEVDPSVLGGVLLRYHGMELDGTVKERLLKLRRTLVGQVVSFSPGSI